VVYRSVILRLADRRWGSCRTNRWIKETWTRKGKLVLGCGDADNISIVYPCGKIAISMLDTLMLSRHDASSAPSYPPFLLLCGTDGHQLDVAVVRRGGRSPESIWH
jgi:hypothetical protein